MKSQKALPGILDLDALPRLLGEALEALGGERGDQVVLRREVAVDRPDTDLRGLGDVRHLGVEALVGESFLAACDHGLPVATGVGPEYPDDASELVALAGFVSVTGSLGLVPSAGILI